MFGFFDNDRKRVSRLRNDFEDIRQRVLFKMNPFEQYSFGTVFDHIPEDLSGFLDSVDRYDFKRLREVGEFLLVYARDGYNHFCKLDGLAGEGGRAGAEGIALLAIETLAKSCNRTDALLLVSDIERFRLAVNAFVTSDQYANQSLPHNL